MRLDSLFRIGLLAAMLCFVGCGSGHDTVNGNNGGTTSTFTVTPATQTAAPGQTVVYNIAAQPTAPLTTPIALNVTGLPSKATAVFNPPQIALNNGATSGTSGLTITLDPTTPPGIYPITIQALAGTTIFGVAQTSLNVQTSGTQQGFTLTVSPPSASVSVNGPAVFNVTVTPANSFVGSVNLFVTGSGGDVIVTSPTPNVLSLNGSQPATATFQVSRVSGTSGGSTQTLLITATNGTITQTATVTIQLQ